MNDLLNCVVTLYILVSQWYLILKKFFAIVEQCKYYSLVLNLTEHFFPSQFENIFGFTINMCSKRTHR